MESPSPWHNAKWEELIHLSEEDPRKLSESAQIELLYMRARAGDFKLYVQLITEQKFEFDLVHDLIAAFFMDLIFLRNVQSLLSLGPRHGKSALMCYLVTYLYGLNGGLNEQLYNTYGGDLSTRFGREIRNVMGNPIFLELFPDSALSPDARGAKSFSTISQGKFYASSVGGALTGMGAGLQNLECFPGGLIADDPVKDMQSALSEVVMGTTNQWIMSEMFTRGNLNHFKLITATRYSLFDVHETLLKGRVNIEDDDSPYVNQYHSEYNPYGWRYLNIPTLCENVETDPLLRTEIDQAAWPSRFPTSVLVRKRHDDPFTFSALYQGRPVPRKGSTWKREFLRFADVAPRMRYIFLSIDSAYGVAGDESVITAFGIPEVRTDPNIYVLDQVGSNLWEFPELMKSTQGMFRLHGARLILIEKAASGISLGQSLESQANLPIFLVPATKGKPQRFSEVLMPQREGKVVYVRGDWNAKLVNQMSSFPFAAHDDRSDSLVLGLWYWLTILKGGKSIPEVDDRVNYEDLMKAMKEATASGQSSYDTWGLPLV